MSEHTPIPVQRRGKYDWGILQEQGWLFIERDDALLNHASSIRNSATAAGLHVKVVVAEHEGELGFLVTPR